MEAVAAISAVEGFLRGVGSLMGGEVGTHTEVFSTLIAHVGLFPSVCSLVFDEVQAPTEALVVLWAFARLLLNLSNLRGH